MDKTSFEVVAFVRRLSGERRVGHGGTLDPKATGVLPVGLGRGTRVAEFLAQENKVYRAQVELGTATDSYDVSGKVTWRGDVSAVTRELVEAALDSFRGLIEQTPPMYSALKYQGQPLYRLARAGIEVPRLPRKVNIFRLELLDFELPLLTLEVACSKGTYIRSLAHDLGQALGCGAHLKSLVIQMSRASQIIHRRTQRSGANWCITSSEVAALLMNIQGFQSIDDGHVMQGGIVKGGVLMKTWQIFIDPLFPANKILMGYQGPSILDTGIIYSPYIPMEITPNFYNPDDFSIRRAIRSEEHTSELQSLS